MNEADEMSQGILEQLHGQREALVTSRTKVEDMQDLALETRGMLKALDRKACTELVFLYSTIALLIVLILVVAWHNTAFLALHPSLECQSFLYRADILSNKTALVLQLQRSNRRINRKLDAGVRPAA
eukprot:16652-Heterococcus_DN1.PRE.2